MQPAPLTRPDHTTDIRPLLATWHVRFATDDVCVVGASTELHARRAAVRMWHALYGSIDPPEITQASLATLSPPHLYVPDDDPLVDDV